MHNLLSTITDEDLTRVRITRANVGWPPPGERTALACLLVILDQEWAHHRFVVRDLDALAATHPPGSS